MAKRSRISLGDYASAALPRLWAVKKRKGLSNAELGREIGVNGAMASKLLYGDRRAGRDLALRCEEKFGVPINLWSAPLPSSWQLPEVA
jgi:plasmid maintenance system antidote protein VapI